MKDETERLMITITGAMNALRDIAGEATHAGASLAFAANLLAAIEVLRLAISRAQDAEKARYPLRVVTAERTPETVLRAMLRAYEAATFDACVAYFQADKDTPENRMRDDRARFLHRQCEVIRREAAGVASGYWDPVDFDVPGETPAGSARLMADYEARLSGAKPIDAPPETP